MILLKKIIWWFFKRKHSYPHPDYLIHVGIGDSGFKTIYLTEPEKEMYFMYCYSGYSIMDIASYRRQTRERIRQILCKIERKLKRRG